MLRLAAPPAAGQMVKCPKCGNTFLPASSPNDLQSAPTIPSQSPANNMPPPSRKVKTSRVDDNTPPPRKSDSKAQRDEDDRDEDGDDGPRKPKKASKKQRYDDEDDVENDRPRKNASRSQRDDDEDDDRSRRSQRNKQGQGQNSGLIIGMIAGGGLVLLLAIGGLVVWLVSSNKPDKDKQDVAIYSPPANTSPTSNQNDPAKPEGQNTPSIPNTQSTSPDRESTPPNTQSTPPNTQSTPAPPKPAMSGDIPLNLKEKTSKATAFIQVVQGSKMFTGSGFIVKSSGDTAYIMTNYHVVGGDDDPPEKEKPPQGQPGPASPPNPGFGPGRPRMPGGPGRPPGFGPPAIGPPAIGPPAIGPPAIGPPAIGPPGFGPRGFGPPGFPGFGPPGFGPGAGTGGDNSNKPTPKTQRPEISVILNRGTPDEKSLSADLVAFDEDADLATLRIVGARNLPPALDLAEDAGMAETMPIYIFGFPGGSKNIVIGKGTVSQIRRDENNEVSDLQLNGELNPGNSGGPVVDTQGRLVGVAVSTVLGKHVGWAVPTAKLNQMFKGSIKLGVVAQFRQQGAVIQLHGESWVYDRMNKIRQHSHLQVAVDESRTKVDFPPNQFFVLARLTDPMHKIDKVNLHYSVAPSNPLKKDSQNWPPLPDAQKLPLKIGDQNSTADLKLPPGSKADQMYAFQFSFVNGEGQTIFTEPHLLRLTFPANTKQVNMQITGFNDEPTRRYIADTVQQTFPGKNIKLSQTPNGLNVEIEPVDNPKTIVEKIKFGKVVSDQGWSISVEVKDVKLPVPSVNEIDRALDDLKSTDNRVRKDAAERLAKVYAVLPDLHVEVAKALEPLVLDKDFWLSQSALNAMKLWTSKENVPGLAGYLELDNADQRRGAVLAIVAKFKDPAAAKGLANCLSSGFDRGNAAAALKAIGPAAEKAVFPFLSHKDSWTVREACLVLKEIGTAESIAPIQALLDKKPDFVIEPTAKEALQAVKSRMK
ncbi:MAG TPA: trypsin-like peptidase domain-containing protein [Gemmata sp.]|nr:trypsin-like peptidase domain-containing protein [Gemmata sp.]